jgi:hypothetical protein
MKACEQSWRQADRRDPAIFDNPRNSNDYRATVSLVQQPGRLCTEPVFFARSDGAAGIVPLIIRSVN